ncbi:uncharacterized protein LOC134260536 isoform X2 [Saccostrea cucullata]|uniref:uncharacterized protein LOC134260536 isoform X2 n=1 Tax=Saccostrea cuccullata TaxID=36930 RepID=UPI002ED33C4B
MLDTRVPVYAIPVALFSWIVALLTPGWIIYQKLNALLDIHFASILSLLLCGVGCRILWASVKKWRSNPKKAVIGGVLVLIAATFEHVLLSRFYGYYFLDGTECSNGVAYSVIIAGLGFLLVLFSVVMILVRFVAPQTQADNDQLISEETRMVKTRVLPVALLLGLLFKIVAFATPGWIMYEETHSTTWIGIFYSRTYEGDNSRTTSFLDRSRDEFGIIGLQINCVINVVLSGAGILVFILNSRRVSKHVMVKPVAYISSGIFLCVGVTLEFALLLRFIGMCILIFLQSIWFPYSFVLACVSFALHLYSVVVILIRYKRGNEEGNNDNQMTENPSCMGIHQDVITDNANVIADNRPEVMTDNDDLTKW